MRASWTRFAPILGLCACGAEAPVGYTPAHSPAGEFTMVIYPQDGRAAIVSKSAGVYYTGWSVATRGTGASTVTLSTPQNQVSYVDAGGVCHSNGGPTCNVSMTGPNKCMVCSNCNACNGMLPTTAPCGTPGTFCAPIQMVSNFGFALPDVVLQLANRATDTRNSITSCTDSSTYAGGQCAQDADNAKKVDSATSSLTSPVAGCSYCYGNRPSLTAATLGLRDAMLPGATSTDKIALRLTNSVAFNIDGLINYATPIIDSVALDDVGVPVSCATINLTNATVTGGGFGPPGACTTTACAVSGIPGSGSVLDFVRQGDNVVFGPIANTTVWSDSSAAAVVGTTMVGSTAKARITAPSTGASVLSNVFNICPPHGPLDHFGLAIGTPAPGTNSTFTFSLVAQDANNMRVTNASGAVTLTMTRNGAMGNAGTFLFVTPNANPANYSWTGADSGGHRFTGGARTGASGSYRITATQGSVTGSVDFTVD